MKDQWNKFKDSKWIAPVFFAIVFGIAGLIAYMIVFQVHLGLLIVFIVAIWLIAKVVVAILRWLIWKNFQKRFQKFCSTFLCWAFLFFAGGRAAAEKSGASTLLFVKTHFL